MPPSQAPQHIGESRCIKGKVFHVETMPGLADLVFCNDRNGCAFTVRVFADANESSALHKLEGRTLSINGLLRDENGGAEIILPNSRQLMPYDSELPSFMKAFDVEERGHGSAGSSRALSAKRTAAKKQTATLPVSIPEDTEEF